MAAEILGLLVMEVTTARALARLRASISIALVDRKGEIFEAKMFKQIKKLN